MSNKLREYENKAVQKTLQSSYCPSAIREAREKQDEILDRRFLYGPHRIADIGCGTGYHGSKFAPICQVYHGFEISPQMADIARNAWREKGLVNAEIFVGDVAEVELEPEFYNLVWCLYFTPGNFRDESEDLGLYTDAYLDRNPKFVAVMSRFYAALVAGGSMFLTIYKDVPEAEEAQIDFYEKTDQQVITPRGSRFVATAEHFWSVRWTERSMLSNLLECGIRERDVTFNELNRIAWLVEIKK